MGVIRVITIFAILTLLTVSSSFVYADASPDLELLLGVRATSEQLKIHDTKAASHRLRIPAAILETLSNPEFLDRHPEYRPLAAQLPQTIEAASHHDYAKNNLPKTSSTIQTLAKADAIGVDWRSLDPDHPFRKAMLNSIQDLNQADDLHWKKTLERSFKNPHHRELLTDLVKAIDYYDVPFARQTDFGAHRLGHMKRPVESGKQWINRQKSLGLSQDSVKRMSSIMDFLDEKIDYPSIVQRYNPDSLGQKSFSRHAASLINEAERRSVATSARFRMKSKGWARATVGAGLAAAPAMATAAEFVYDPKSVEPHEFLGSLVFIRETADCDSPSCGQWRDQCQQQQLSEESCTSLFFTNPLPEQSRLRMDGDLNRKLSSIAGRVDELKCQTREEGDLTLAQIQFSDPKEGVFTQTIAFNRIGKVQEVRVRSLNEISPRHHIIRYDSSGRPDVLQYFSTDEQRYISKPAEEWVDHVTHLVSLQSNSTNIAFESAIRAKNVTQSSARSIFHCCQKKSCQEEMNKVSEALVKSNPVYIRPIRVAK